MIGGKIFFFIMLEVCCGLCRSFGPEVWIPESRHPRSWKIALYCNQKRTLFSIWVLHVEFHLWSAFPLNFIGQKQSNKIRRQLNCNAFRLETIFVPEHLSDFFLYRGGMLCTLWKAITDFREKHTWRWHFSSLLCRGEKISFQCRAGVLSKGLLHFNPVFVYRC